MYNKARIMRTSGNKKSSKWAITNSYLFPHVMLAVETWSKKEI